MHEIRGMAVLQYMHRMHILRRWTSSFDPKKNTANLRKHGVSLADGDGVLNDPLALTIEDETVQGEQRFLSLGMNVPATLMVLVWTRRQESIRVISARKAEPRGGGRMRKEADSSKGRRGAVVPATGKTRITIYIDDEILRCFKEQSEKTGRGYQTLINEALGVVLGLNQDPLTPELIRRIVREELEAHH